MGVFFKKKIMGMAPLLPCFFQTKRYCPERERERERECCLLENQRDCPYSYDEYCTYLPILLGQTKVSLLRERERMLFIGKPKGLPILLWQKKVSLQGGEDS